MKQVVTTLVDDLDQSTADETVKFALDGAQYEIDLSAKNAAKLRDALAAYVAAGHRAGKATPTPAPVDLPPAAPIPQEDRYDRMTRPELVKLAVARGASSIARAKVDVVRQWLRDNPNGTPQAQGTAEAGREMAAKRSAKPAPLMAQHPASPDRKNLTPGQRADLNQQVRRFAALHGHRLSNRGKIPEGYYAAQYHDDPSLLPQR